MFYLNVHNKALNTLSMRFETLKTLKTLTIVLIIGRNILNAIQRRASFHLKTLEKGRTLKGM